MQLRLAGFYAVVLGFIVLFTAPALAEGPDNNGRYYDLKGSYPCERDVRNYGQFNDYGYWKGGNWCGQHMPSGYYVYVDGIWYVWRRRRR